MDRGIRPYASSAKTYNEMMDEETEQYYRSLNYDIKPALKQPYCYSDYTEMMYLYSGGEQGAEDNKSDANIVPVIIATVTSPDFAFFDFFVEESNILFDDTFDNLDLWTAIHVDTGGIYEISPAGEFHGKIEHTAPINPDYVLMGASFTSTTIPTLSTLEFELKIDTIGSSATSNNIIYSLGIPNPDFQVYFKIDGVYVSGTEQIGTVVPTSNGTATYQKWRFVNTAIDGSSSSTELFLETAGTYVSQGSVTNAFPLSTPLSYLYFQYSSQSATATEIHMRNIKLYYE